MAKSKKEDTDTDTDTEVKSKPKSKFTKKTKLYIVMVFVLVAIAVFMYFRSKKMKKPQVAATQVATGAPATIPASFQASAPVQAGGVQHVVRQMQAPMAMNPIQEIQLTQHMQHLND
jgi:flagellar basal body-associated protein FliL